MNVALTWIRTHDWDAEEWRDRAACRDTRPELFFPIGTTGVALDQIDAAQRVCEQCPVTERVPRVRAGTNQESGVWGGLTEEERRRLRKGAEVTAGSRSHCRLDVASSRLAASRADGRRRSADDYSSTRGIATGTRTRTDVPLSLCISIEPSSSPVTSACTIVRPRPRDVSSENASGRPDAVVAHLHRHVIRRRAASVTSTAPRRRRRGTRGRPRSA